MMKKTYEMDMCSGPLLHKILIYAIPLMLSGILQLLFNAADVIVVGRFAGHESLAAVGSTSALINLLINVFIGLSVGANVLVAQYFGAGKVKEVQDTVHTAIAVSLICGAVLVFLGIFAAGPLLRLMGTPQDVLDKSVLYMRIYFAGMPVIMLYNFGAAILRAVGDTKRPLYFLMAAGVVNVVLNLIFIRLWGYLAAGYTTLVCYAVNSLMHYYFMRKVCREYLSDVRPYDPKLLLLITGGFMAVGFLYLWTYQNVFLRYGLTALILLAVLVQRKRVAPLLRGLLEKRKKR